MILFLLGEKELKSRSQVVQRDFPRPSDVNMTVLRPTYSDVPLTDFQRVKDFQLILEALTIRYLVSFQFKCSFTFRQKN